MPENAFLSLIGSVMDSNLTEWGQADNWGNMSQEQKDAIKKIDKFKKRLEYRLDHKLDALFKKK